MKAVARTAERRKVLIRGSCDKRRHRRRSHHSNAQPRGKVRLRGDLIGKFIIKLAMEGERRKDVLKEQSLAYVARKQNAAPFPRR